MPETALSVKYDGPAVADHRMDVRDLAPALLALGQAFTEAGTILHPDQEPVALSITATSEGSFELQLILEAKHAWDSVVRFFSSTEANALDNLKDTLVGGTIGLLFLIRRLRGRRIAKREALPAAGQTRLTLDDGSIVEISDDVLTLYGSVSIRRKVREVVRPLERDGIESVSFHTGREEVLTISTGDLPAFDLLDSPILSEDRMLMTLQVVAAPVGESAKKWRLSDGDATFSAVVEDRAFLERVDDGIERFGNGDILEVAIRVRQTRDARGLHTERFIERVERHTPATEQLSFDATPDP